MVRALSVPVKGSIGLRCSGASCISRAACLLLCILFLTLTVEATSSVADDVPVQDLFHVVFSGSEWSYVLDTFARQQSPARVSTLVNPASASVADLLTASLSVAPGVTGLSLSDCQFDAKDGLFVVYAVTRFANGNELTNTQINDLVRGADTSNLQSLYWRSGGRPTEKITVIDAAMYTRKEKCGEGCRYAVGIVVPVVCCAMLCIPVFISLVSPQSTSLKLDPPPPPPPCAQVCCSRHAMTLTSSYKLAGGAGLSDSDDAAPTLADGYPAGYTPPPREEEPDDVYYARVAQEAFEAERQRREDENRWRRANGLPLLADPANSKRRPRVLVVEDRQEVVQNTLMDLDSEERAKLEGPQPEEEEETGENEKDKHSARELRGGGEVRRAVSNVLSLPRHDAVAESHTAATLGMQGFHSTVSTVDSYRPNRRLPASAPARRRQEPRELHSQPTVVAVPDSVGGNAENSLQLNSSTAPPVSTVKPGDSAVGVEPPTAEERQRMPLRDTGLIGGEIVGRAPLASASRRPSSGLGSIPRRSSSAKSRGSDKNSSTN